MRFVLLAAGALLAGLVLVAVLRDPDTIYDSDADPAALLDRIRAREKP